MKNGAELIAEERLRQQKEEGWTPEHDDQHKDRQLILAAGSYLTVAETAEIRDDATHYHEQPPYNQGPAHWPWDRKWWKPSNDPIKNLVKAGALIAAEIDRLQRQ